MITIDDSYIEFPNKFRGRKPKKRFVKDGKEYIFKYGSTNYEIFAELIAEQIGKQMGIQMAKYKIAELKGIYGVLTVNFLKSDQRILSIDFFKDYITNMMSENNVEANLKENSVTNIVQAVCLFDTTIDSNKLFMELSKRWAFYGLIIENDKNPTNIAFIKSGRTILLAPDYDNSNMARLSENIDAFVDEIQRGGNIYKYIDASKQSLTMFNNESDLFLEEFSVFCEKYPQVACEVVKSVLNVNVDKALDEVERINNLSLPWSIRYWVSKTISIRISDILRIYTKKLKKIDEVELGSKKRIII